jgi:membrane-bound metal-dependent hydrolase YbcI (DUF457 family)
MFIGHFAVGLAAKKFDSSISLGTAFIAVQFLDLLWPLLVLFGIEQVDVDPGNTAFTPLHFVYYPYSHSLVFTCCWSILFGLLYYLITRKLNSSVIISLLVLSHWLLDLITHTTDLPLSPWSDMKMGFGLWNSIVFSIIVEVSLFLFGTYLYIKATTPKNRKGKILFWSLIIFLLFTYVSNIVGPLPPSGKDVALVAISMWLLVGWGYWIERNRISTPG